MIIPTLYRFQKNRGGYLTREDLTKVAEVLNVPLHRVQSLVSFFPHFRTTPPPKVTVHICRDMSCHRGGAVTMTERIEKYAKQRYGEAVEVCGVSCLGRCDRAPAAMINERLFAGRSEEELRLAIDQSTSGLRPSADSDARGTVKGTEKWQMEIYDRSSQVSPDYRLVRNYLKAPDPAGVLKALETAGLLGMGGAGGRTYLKWGDVLAAEGKAKYLVCNADESEPGTFKDREILLRFPHLVIEGMILGGLVVGAQRGWIYVRHEYPEQIKRLQAEINRANDLGILGQNILGSGEKFFLEVFVSPGGYICGEQTALIEAMEDKRAEPRNRPPELMTNGYQNQPTLLNNVETFAWVPAILDRDSGKWYRDEGQKTGPFDLAGQKDLARGRRLFSISGDVVCPGVYEVPTGITLGELIDEYAGGMRGGLIAAVALSGPSGGLWPAKIPVSELNQSFAKRFVPEGTTTIDIRDLPMDINVSRTMGYMLGAGIVVYNDQADLVSEALACSRFFRNESCGKCVPCRIGSEKITAMATGIDAGRVALSELPIFSSTVRELSEVMEATSICGLGQVASNPVRSLFRFFPHLVASKCPNNGPQSSGNQPQGEYDGK
ncbi:MAG TPA: NADH-quinone oxidoreductase subunit L [Planctomycetaceae bacterium]|nr:NADH-quinone oxidoreductase subunit L [Planctomycetaceae bacterium]